MPEHPWILCTASPEPFGFRSTRCGVGQVFDPTEVPVDAYLAACRAFIDLHTRCVDQDSGPA